MLVNISLDTRGDCVYVYVRFVSLSVCACVFKVLLEI